MLKDILEAIRRREEPVVVGGVKLIARELEHAADVDAMQDNQDLIYKLVVRSTYDEQGGLVFTDEDIAALKAGAKLKLMPLFQAVARVNGMALEDDVKNSGAAPDSGLPSS